MSKTGIMTKSFIGLFMFPVLLFQSVNLIGQQERDTIIDGIAAIVGANMILKSDIESQYIQFRIQGNIQGSPQTVKCQIFENMLLQKLLLNQAQVDSVTVTDASVESEMDRRMRFFISQAGSQEKLEEYYQKSVLEIKNELRGIIKEQMMIEEEQRKITKDLTATPSEVKAFFKKLPKDSIPEINSEIQIGIIVKQPTLGEAEKQVVKEKLKGLKERVQKGDDFSTLAILYSEDPGSSKKGGELGLFKRGEMHPEFEAAAFRLKPGEVSDIVETEDGYHLIQMIERRGEYINVRHILIQPKVSFLSLNAAKIQLDTIANLIERKKITFDEAVVKYSDDPSKNNGGLLLNPQTGESKFRSNELDPKIFFVIDKLKTGEVSNPVLYKSDRGKEEYRLYYLKERSSPHKANLETDYSVIQEMTMNKKREKEVETWVQDKAARTYISILPPYRNCPFRKDWFNKHN